VSEPTSQAQGSPLERMVSFLRRLRGRWRLWWGLCPACNSDAPELYSCPVCEYYSSASGDPFPPTADTKALWWGRWSVAKETNVRISDPRPETPDVR
jgi:hypothetical protein